MRIPSRYRKFGNNCGAIPLLPVALFLVLLVLLLLWLAGCLGGNPGKPQTINLVPARIVLQPGIRATVHISAVIEHPLPRTKTTYVLRVDENDFWGGDDELLNPFRVTFDPSSTDGSNGIASGTFELECKNLQSNGEFDLTAIGGGTSKEEEIHQIHSQYGAFLSSNEIECECAEATPKPNEEEP